MIADYPRNSDPFSHDHYVLKRHLLKLMGARFSIYGPGEQLVLVADQKAFKLKEDIRLYADEGLTRPALGIFARNIIDFSAAYDIVNLVDNTKLGAMRREGMASTFVRDTWQVFDPWDRPIGDLHEDNPLMGLVRRFITNLVPQNYDLMVGGQKVVDLKQNFNPFNYHLNIDFLAPAAHFDRRMGLAAAVLIAAIEGRQVG